MNEYPVSHGSPGMAAAATALAFFAVPLFSVFYISIPLAATAIILALLSRGDGVLYFRSKLAILIASCAILASGVSTVYTVQAFRQSPELRRQLRQIFDYYYEQYSDGEEAEEYPWFLQEPSPENVPADTFPGQDMEGGMQV